MRHISGIDTLEAVRYRHAVLGRCGESLAKQHTYRDFHKLIYNVVCKQTAYTARVAGRAFL